MNKDDLSNHPLKFIYLEFIQQRISELQNLNLKTANIDLLKFMLRNLCRAYISTTLTISEDKSIFRATKHTNEEKDTCFESVNRIYPDPKFLKKLGRANREGQAVFYFSADPGIALTELRATKGDVFTILECKPRKDASPLLIPAGIYEMAQKHNAKIGGDMPERALRIAALFENDGDTLYKYRLIDNFIADEFLKVVDEGQEYLYKLTIPIAELLLDFGTDNVPIDGIAYPSIASDKINANLVLLPQAFHRIYEPVGCKRVQINEMLPNQDLKLNVPGFDVCSREAKRISGGSRIEW